MSGRNNYLPMEAPETKATVEFLSELVTVELTVDRKAGVVIIVATSMANETDSTWAIHEFEVPLTKEKE